MSSGTGMSAAKATAVNQVRLSERAANEGRFGDAADLMRRAIANFKRDGFWYTNPFAAARLQWLRKTLDAQAKQAGALSAADPHLIGEHQ